MNFMENALYKCIIIIIIIIDAILGGACCATPGSATALTRDTGHFSYPKCTEMIITQMLCTLTKFDG